MVRISKCSFSKPKRERKRWVKSLCSNLNINLQFKCSHAFIQILRSINTKIIFHIKLNSFLLNIHDWSKVSYLSSRWDLNNLWLQYLYFDILRGNYSKHATNLLMKIMMKLGLIWKLFWQIMLHFGNQKDQYFKGEINHAAS